MQYIVRGEKLEVTDALRNHAEKKISRLERYFDTETPFTCHITLSVLRGMQKVEVTIPMTGIILRAEDVHSDMYAAIDLVVEKLERQIRKHKTKISRRNRQNGVSTTVFMDAEPVFVEKETQEAEGIEIVRTKRFDFKPMDAEEAVLQMEMIGHSFFVFSNAETNEVNVVYRRKDGKYGLIEPE